MVFNRITHLLSIHINGQYTKQTQGSYWVWWCNNAEINETFHSTFASFSPKFLGVVSGQTKTITLSYSGSHSAMGIMIATIPQATTNAELCVNIKVQLN